MAVYQMYFEGMKYAPAVGIAFGNKRPEGDAWPYLKEALENTRNYFVFIVTREMQWDQWLAVRKKYCLEEYQVLELPDFIPNFNHSATEKRLQIIVLKGKGTNEI